VQKAEVDPGRYPLSPNPHLFNPTPTPPAPNPINLNIDRVMYRFMHGTDEDRVSLVKMIVSGGVGWG